MDKDIGRLQELLESNYKIIGITQNYQEGLSESKVTLERQSKREIITSNSEEFLKFISKFSKIK